MTEKQIGDVNSQEKGSGARYNQGKAALELIPLTIVAASARRVGHHEELCAALGDLGKFQTGGGEDALYSAINEISGDKYWSECAQVFDYGRRKYAEWNWAKGMPWSVPIGCAARHLYLGMMQEGKESLDKESGLTHRGHFLCNIVMLLTYLNTYPEGDDRPSKWFKTKVPEIVEIKDVTSVRLGPKRSPASFDPNILRDLGIDPATIWPRNKPSTTWQQHPIDPLDKDRRIKEWLQQDL